MQYIDHTYTVYLLYSSTSVNLQVQSMIKLFQPITETRSEHRTLRSDSSWLLYILLLSHVSAKPIKPISETCITSMI